MNYHQYYEGENARGDSPTHLELKALSEESVRALIHETVRETLLGLGFEIARPTEMQADILYLRKMRQGSEEVRRIVVRSALGVVVTALIYVVWEGLKGKL